MILRPEDVEPYFAVFDSEAVQFISGVADAPKRRQYIAAEVAKTKFNEFAEFEYFKKAKSWWEGGMQKWISGSVTLITDNIEDGIFIFYNVQNSPKGFQFLGRLCEGCRLHEAALAAFTTFAGSL